MQKTAIIKELKYFSPELILKAWPLNVPLLFLGGTGEHAILPICFEEVDFKEVAQLPLKGEEQKHRLPFISGYIGLVSYDDFCPYPREAPPRRPSRAFRVHKSLVFDQVKRQLFLCGRKQQHPRPIGEGTIDASDFLFKFQKQRETATHFDQGPTNQLLLKSYLSSEHYLNMSQKAISEIRKGRFYQINLLRYFTIENEPTRLDLLARFFEQSGPFGAIFLLDDLSVISFSPERFVKIEPEDSHLTARTYPIKGTIGRDKEKKKDLAALKCLKNSQKDHQELHMIVDLMRNDLNKISAKGSVKVEEAAKIKAFKQVYHLEASIRSKLKDGLSLLDFFSSLAPGGSITGAPKDEVMKAISESEERNRGYFMGSIFYKDDCGSFDSSILIRTLVSKTGTTNKFEYAAGSGIVLKSMPESELNEIAAKCRVITQ
ncbi:MAG: anthranilate synthase component I family protein [Oligoflexales bacterium]|nr:anthranilate synthase component I family protein [Oligoflexales bacterium]